MTLIEVKTLLNISLCVIGSMALWSLTYNHWGLWLIGTSWLVGYSVYIAFRLTHGAQREDV